MCRIKLPEGELVQTFRITDGSDVTRVIAEMGPDGKEKTNGGIIVCFSDDKKLFGVDTKALVKVQLLVNHANNSVVHNSKKNHP